MSNLRHGADYRARVPESLRYQVDLTMDPRQITPQELSG
jgi:hypothetical protein